MKQELHDLEFTNYFYPHKEGINNFIKWFAELIETNSIAMVREVDLFLTKYLINKISKKKFNHIIHHCFAYGLSSHGEEIMKFICYCSKMKDFIDINYDNDKIFKICVENGSLESLKFLLTHSIRKTHPDIEENNNYAIKYLCSYNSYRISQQEKLKKIKYLLTPNDLTKDINIHVDNDFCIKQACRNGYLDIVEYLLTSSDLTEHSDIHAENDYALIWADIKSDDHFMGIKCRQVVEYLVFDYAIDISESIRQHIKQEEFIYGKSKLQEMFDQRELNNKLKHTLPNKNMISNIVKV